MGIRLAKECSPTAIDTPSPRKSSEGILVVQGDRDSDACERKVRLPSSRPVTFQEIERQCAQVFGRHGHVQYVGTTKPCLEGSLQYDAKSQTWNSNDGEPATIRYVRLRKE